MKKRLGWILVFVCLAAAACEKKHPERSGETNATVGSVATTGDVPKTATTAGEGAPGGESWCADAHADTVKLVEAMKETMKRTGKEDDMQYTVPERSEYIELCQKLPLEMQKCLVMSYSVKNKDACQKAQDSLSGDAKAAYSELMGK